MTAQHVEPPEFERVPVGELRRLRALARIASPEELALAEDVARQQELDALEEAGGTAGLSEEEARRLLGIAERTPDDRYVSMDEVRRRLGLPQ
jgi:hypothetical protein